MKKNKNFKKQVLTLVSGTMGSQIITILMVPILARIYTPANFGGWALFVAVSGLLSLVSAGRYDSAIILPKRIKEARVLAFISLCHISVVSLLIGLGVVTAWQMDLLPSNQAGWLLLPVSVIVCGYTQVFSSLLVRARRYSAISRTRVAQSVSVAVTNLIFGYALTTGYFQNGSALLVFATILGQVIALFVAMQGLGARRVIPLLKKSSYSIAHVKKYKDFPLFSTPATVLGSVLTDLPMYVFIYFFGSYMAGQYTLAQRCLMLPVAILGGAMSQVNTRDLAQLSASGQPIKKELFSAWLRAAYLAFVPTVVLLFFANELFGLVFGAGWNMAGEMATVMAIPIFIMFIFSVGSGSHAILGMQHFSLLAALCSVGMKIPIIYALIGANPLHLLFALALVDILVVASMNSYAYWRAAKVENE